MKKLLILYHLFTIIEALYNCETPDGRIGKCISVYDCASIMNQIDHPDDLSNQDYKFIRQSLCGWIEETPLVCCQDIGPLKSGPDPPNVSNHKNLKLLDPNCGQFVSPKILYGQKIGVLEHSWMALLIYQYNDEFSTRCSGTIISSQYILTAAHCVTNLPSNRTLYGVRVGEHDFGKKRDCDFDEKGDEILCLDDEFHDFLIQKIKIHPNYNATTHRNDVALIQLHRKLNFQWKNVGPICLPIDDNKLDERSFKIMGWGSTEARRSKQILQADVSRIPIEECEKPYKGNNWYKQICALGKAGRDAVGYGDSGGPLLAYGRYGSDVRLVQFGIVSFGILNYGVYTSVQYYLDWILDNLD